MLSKLQSIIVAIIFIQFAFGFSAFAQYSGDALLVSDSGNTAILHCSGIGKNKKEAIEMAKKSAISVYLYNGITGLNGDNPLLGYSPSNAAKDHINNLFESGRYQIFLGSVEFDKEMSQKVGKEFQAHVKLELYTKLLYNDLKNSGIISANPTMTNMTEVQSEIVIPTIMVVPYCKTGENFQQKIQNTPYLRMAISKVNSGFVEKGVETKDVEQMIRIADSQQAMNNEMSLNDIVLNDCGADVAVYVDIAQSTAENGTTVTLTLSAIDVSTGNTYATTTEVTPRKRASVELICNALVDAIIDDFLKQITAAFSRKTSAGNTVSITLNISNTSAITFDYEMEDYTPLRDALHQWVRRNAVEGKFHLKGSTKTMMMFDGINVPNKDEDTGSHLDVNDFSLKLYRYLRSQGLQIERNVNNNRITITIL